MFEVWTAFCQSNDIFVCGVAGVCDIESEEVGRFNCMQDALHCEIIGFGQA